jgi:AraC family transcriptional regulator
MANDFFYNNTNKIKSIKNPDVYIGFIEHIPNNEAFRYYTTSLEVTGGIKTQEGVYSRFVPTHKYAVFKYIGMHHPSETTIKDLLSVHYFAGNWIRSSNYLVADKFRFERVDIGIAKDDYCEVEIFIPITDKKSDTNFDYSWILKLFSKDLPLGGIEE